MVRGDWSLLFSLAFPGMENGLNQGRGEVYPGVMGSERPSTYPQGARVPQGLTGAALFVVVVVVVVVVSL